MRKAPLSCEQGRLRRALSTGLRTRRTASSQPWRSAWRRESERSRRSSRKSGRREVPVSGSSSVNFQCVATSASRHSITAATESRKKVCNTFPQVQPHSKNVAVKNADVLLFKFIYIYSLCNIVIAAANIKSNISCFVFLRTSSLCVLVFCLGPANQIAYWWSDHGSYVSLLLYHHH